MDGNGMDAATPLKRRLPSLLLLAIAISSALVAGAAVSYRYRAPIRLAIRATQSVLPFAYRENTSVVDTSLYNLWAQWIWGPFEGRDGGIAAVEDGVLLATRTGAFWFLAPQRKQFYQLSLRAPINTTEFRSAMKGVRGVRTDLFSVKDIAVRQQGDTTFQLFVSYHHWNVKDHCLTLRVSETQLSYAALAPAAPDDSPARWKLLFETSPCMTENITSGNFAAAQQAGGRIAIVDADHLLVAVGDHYHDGVNAESYPQSLDNSYGKTISITVSDRHAEIFSRGHRNTEGLAIAGDGTIFLTEHGPQGGDELNTVVEGADYGWPQVTYGTNYGSSKWPFNPHQGRHLGYKRPTYAWVPSIGISNLVSVSSGLFERWKSDLIVASLTARTLYRVRLVAGRVVLVEPIPVGHRVRDIIQGADGSLVLKTDDNYVVFLRPATSYQRSGGTDILHGKLLAAQCTGCHTFKSGEGDRIGPNLWQVVGRPVASREGFGYSAALRELPGSWTPERLREFLGNPQSVAEGTSMQFEPVADDEDLTDLIAYLQTLH